MAMTSALMQLYHDYSSIWEYVPVEIVEKYKELEGLYKLPKRMKSLEESDTPVPLIPYIGNLSQPSPCMSFPIQLTYQQ